jgi:DNA-binding NtrC family response regulator
MVAKNSGEMLNRRILIVDDDKVFISDLVLLLESEFDIQTANLTKEAKSIISTEKPELLLLDYQLGGKETGFDLIDYLSVENRKIPVVMMSDQPTVSTVVKAMQKGVYTFLPKSERIESFISAIHKALKVKKDIQEPH